MRYFLHEALSSEPIPSRGAGRKKDREGGEENGHVHAWLRWERKNVTGVTEAKEYEEGVEWNSLWTLDRDSYNDDFWNARYLLYRKHLELCELLSRADRKEEKEGGKQRWRGREGKGVGEEKNRTGQDTTEQKRKGKRLLLCSMGISEPCSKVSFIWKTWGSSQG